MCIVHASVVKGHCGSSVVEGCVSQCSEGAHDRTDFGFYGERCQVIKDSHQYTNMVHNELGGVCVSVYVLWLKWELKIILAHNTQTHTQTHTYKDNNMHRVHKEFQPGVTPHTCVPG